MIADVDKFSSRTARRRETHEDLSLQSHEGEDKHAQKKFQKLVIQTLLNKDSEKIDEDSDESEEELELPQFISTTLDLSQKKLKEVPDDLLRRAEYVQYLYLEGNKLSELSDEFFQRLPCLKWLDLRNNQLTALPTAGLKNHACLEFLLLQGNRIKYLPTELGEIPPLKGIQITDNPIANVPYNVIAEGFHGIIKYLRKINSQENISFPHPDAIVLKPSTATDDSVVKTEKTEFDENGGIVGLSRVTTRQVDEKPKGTILNGPRKEHIGKEVDEEVHITFNQWNEMMKLLKKSKMCSKPKQRIISSSCRNLEKKRSRLGYKQKVMTQEMLDEKARKDLQMAKKRETLEKQARKIQRMKDIEVLKNWRRRNPTSMEETKLLDNYRQCPSKNFVVNTPFDVDPEFLNMLSRIDLYRSLKELEAIQKRRRTGYPKLRITVSELEKQMGEMTNKLNSLSMTDPGEVSPRIKQSHLTDKIIQMQKMKKTIQNLQMTNMAIL